MTRPTCKIQWIDKVGQPTPDDFPAVGVVWREAYREPYPTAVNGFIDYTETERFPICARHTERLADRSMHHWHFEPYTDDDGNTRLDTILWLTLFAVLVWLTVH